MRILYQAYGAADFLQQALFSALSLLPHDAARECRVTVYTDQPAAFAAHGFDVVTLDAATIAAWRGRFDFVHRMKLEMLRDAVRRDPAAGGWVAVDADTQWRGPPAPLAAALRGGAALMHTPEGTLGPHFHGALHRTLARHWPGLGPVQMNNAGVVGVPAPATAAAAVLDEALALADRLLLRCRQRTWVEQAALSIVLAQRYRIVFAEDALLHYWTVNREIGPALARFFAAHGALATPALARAAAQFDPLPETLALQARLRAQPRPWRHYWTAAKRSWHKRKIDLRVWTARLLGDAG